MTRPLQKIASRFKSFLAGFARDARGNTLAIVAAALVPLTAMIGSGVDMSRAYMAKTRLQSACDAAALAGRRVMQNDQVDANVRAEAIRFFNFNFAQGMYQTAPFTPVVSRSGPGTVSVEASTTIPTTIMRMFGFTTLPLDVSCDASLDFVNTDIMLILDVTGSMAEDVNGLPATGSRQKISAMRDAVKALYQELEPVQAQLEANGLRLRYGVVPYSSTVNVGSLIRDVNPDYLRAASDYQSRVANYATPVISPGTPTTASTTETYGSNITQAQCTSYGNNRYPSVGANPVIAGTSPSPTTSTLYSVGSWTRRSGNGANARGTCVRNKQVTTTTYSTRYSFTNWVYRQATFDTSQYRGGSALIASNTNGTVAAAGTYTEQELVTAATGVGTTTSTWDGCIEERDTVDTIRAGSSYDIPAAAYDLNLNLIPSNPETRWRPQWPDIAHYRLAGSPSAPLGTSASGAACPEEAVRLQVWRNQGQLVSYMARLRPTGSTYHDIGMLWGSRMLSSSGIFADSPDTFNGMPVTRHIVFMTDGQMDTDPRVYGAYGMEQNDMRVSGTSMPSETELNGRHNQRFKMICNAAKSMNVSIWVIAFGTTLSQDMIECASNANQASTSADRDALIARFREIGSNIGALRLTR